MGHFAKLNDNNKVIDILVISNNDFTIDGIEVEEMGINFLNSIFNHTNWKQTSYNTLGGIHYQQNGEPSPDQTKAFRKKYAGIGDTYDEVRDAFIPPQPYPSWVLHEASCLWEAPISEPNDGNRHIWNEDTQIWDVIG